MKILQAGNLVNLGYVVARELRNAGIESDLLMEENPQKTSDPKVFDLNLDGKYPNWIKFYYRNRAGWKRKIIKIMRDSKYELIHSYTELVMFSYLSRRIYVANPTGSDLRELAFSKTIRGMVLRRAYNKAKVVLAASPEVLELLSKLKIRNGVFLPVLMDTSLFSSNHAEKKSDRFIIFHPSNLDWKTKGNDKIVKGFSKFIKNYPNSLLRIIDRGIDSQRTHDLVSKLDLNDKTQFIKGPLDTLEIIKNYRESDVIADQFSIGEFGSIGRETLCIGKPLLGSYHIDKYEKIFGKMPPLINAQTPEEISEKLQFLTDNRFKSKIGQEGRDWAIRYHSSNSIVKKLKIIYDSVLNSEKPSSIRQKIADTHPP